jgi:hypothetical protein
MWWQSRTRATQASPPIIPATPAPTSQAPLSMVEAIPCSRPGQALPFAILLNRPCFAGGTAGVR